MEQYIENEPPPFELTTENIYLDDIGSSRNKKKTKKMVCECQFDPGMMSLGDDIISTVILCACGIPLKQTTFFILIKFFCIELDDPETACGEDCLNRLLLIEWYILLFHWLHVVVCLLPSLFTKLLIYINKYKIYCD